MEPCIVYSSRPECCVSHQFGREVEVSVSQLFIAFCNHLNLGQWELAGNCLAELYNRKDIRDSPVEELIKDVISFPQHFCIGSRVIASPYHLSWMCLGQLEKLPTKITQNLDLKSMKKSAEFKLLLYEAAIHHMSSATVKELYSCFSGQWRLENGQTSPSLLSVTTKNFLCKLLLKDILLAHQIITCISDDVASDHNASLQSIYHEAVQTNICILKDAAAAKSEDEFDEPGQASKRIEAVQKALRSIYRLLVLFSPKTYMSKLPIMELMCKFKYSGDGKDEIKLDPYAICAALVSNHSSFLMDCYVSSKTTSSFDDLVKLFQNEKRESVWSDVFLYCVYSGRHFLEDYVEKALQCVSDDNFHELQALMLPIEFSCLRPLLVLLAWKHCSTITKAEAVLQALWLTDREKNKNCDKALALACDKMVCDMNVIQWCLERLQGRSPVVSSYPYQRALQVLHCPDHHSALWIMHHVSQLSGLSQEEVIEFLRNSDAKDDKFKKAETFASDVAIFTAYWGLKSFMDAIFYSANLERELLCQMRSSSFADECRDNHAFTTASSSIKCSNNIQVYQQMYNEYVTANIEHGIELVCHVYPLCFRLELLEDIFSLLFVRHEQLDEDAAADSGEEETNDEDEKQRSCETSFDSALRTSALSSPMKHPDDVSECEEEKTIDQQLTGVNHAISKEGEVSHIEALNLGLPKRVQKNSSGSDSGKIVTMMAEVHASFDQGANNVFQMNKYHQSAKLDVRETLSTSDNAQRYSSSYNVFEMTSGFMCNVFVVRDLLNFLRKAIDDLRASAIDMSADDSPTANLFSIDQIEFDQNVQRLNCLIKEAEWRFQLVTHSKVPKKSGQVCLPFSLEECEWTNDRSSWSLTREPHLGPGKRKRSSSKKDQGAVIPERKMFETVSSKYPTGHQAVSDDHLSSSSGVVPYMLASKETMLNLCLLTGDHVQARYVIMTCDIGEEAAMSEVNFLEHYEVALQKLHSAEIQTRSAVLEQKKYSSTTGQIEHIDAVARAAAAGLASTTITSIAEELLRKCVLSASLTDRQLEALSRLNIFHTGFLSAMVIADMAFTASRTWDSSQKLLDLANRKLGSYINMHTTCSKLIGFCGLLAQITAVREQTAAFHGDIIQQKYSIANHLCSGTFSLDADLFTRQAGILKNLSRVCEKLLAILGSGKESSKVVKLPLSLDALPPEYRSPVYRYKLFERLHISKRSPGENLEQLKKSDEKTLEAASSSKPVDENKFTFFASTVNMTEELLATAFSLFFPHGRRTSRVHFRYLHLLWKNLNSLADLKLRFNLPCQFRKGDGESIVEGLHVAPSSIISRLLLEHHVSPDSLSEIADELCLDLSTVILESCCPHIPALLNCNGETVTVKVESAAGQVYNGLHEAEVFDERHLAVIKHPGLFVHELLSRLVHLIKDFVGIGKSCATRASCRRIAANKSFTAIAEETIKLNYVDLDLLDTAAEKLCFFVNLYNLLFIHATLNTITTGDNNLPIVDESNFMAMLDLQKIGYRIRDLGYVSLFDLRYFILRVGLPCPSSDDSFLAYRLHPLHTEDPWLKYTCPVEADVLFTLVTGTSCSPALQVLCPELLAEHLLVSRKQYLQHRIIIDKNNQQVWIPSILKVYKQDFLGKENLTDIDLLNFIASSNQDVYVFLNGVKGKKCDLPLVTLKQKPVSCSDAIITLHYDSQHSNLMSIGHRRNNSLPILLMFDATKVQSLPSPGGSPVLSAAKYSVTKEMTSYFRERNELVARFVQLISNPRDMLLADSALFQQFPLLQSFINKMILPFLNLISTDSFQEMVVAILCNFTGQYANVLIAGLRNALHQQKFEELLLSTTLLPDHILSDAAFLDLKDWALCCLIFKQTVAMRSIKIDNSANGDVSASSFLHPWYLAKQISNVDCRSRCTLGCMRLWPVEECVDVLQMCTAAPPTDAYLKQALLSARALMSIYYKVMECATLSYGNTRPRSASDTITQFETYDYWTFTASESLRCPEQVLEPLLTCNEYNTCRVWAKLHNVPLSVRQTIEIRHVHYLLEREGDVSAAYQVLRDVPNSELCLSICTALLHELEDYKHILTICQFILQNLHKVLRKEEILNMENIRLSAKAMLQLPDSLHREYHFLLSCPNLLIEQLLMDFKVEFVSKIYSEWMKSEDEDHLTSLGVGMKWFGDLLFFYASKALEFPVSSAMNSSVSSDGGRSFSETMQTEKLRSHAMTKSVSAECLPFANKHHRRGQSGSFSRFSLKRSCSSGQFVIPLEPPTIENWVPDKSVINCMVCKIEHFSMFNRRHHCRRCGRVVCWSCSKRRAIVKGFGSSPVRICDECHEFHERLQQPSVQMAVDVERIRSTLAATTAPVLPSQEESLHHLPDVIMVQSPMQETSSVDFHGKLSSNLQQNKFTRERFYYEQAPSTNLCISILDLHSNRAACGCYMLKLCDQLSKLLLPIAPGIPNPEVDYILTISMMRNLLLSAKMKFTGADENHELELCDTYLSHVDLIQNVVNSNCREIPSLHELTNVDSARRYRDKLLEEERFQLAMDVSTKCNLDVLGVWVNWGKTHLLTGNFLTARNKFVKCLKISVDKNQPSPPLLDDIVSTLESVEPDPAFLTTTTMTWKDLTTHQSQVKGLLVDGQIYNECLYYLKTYGTHLSLLAFYMRHGCILMALQYLVEQNCSTEIFIDGVFIPCLEKGDIVKLQEQLRADDPTLEKWSTYLTATCKYLDKMQLIHTLYDFQLFMKDYVRAAITCIRFYRTGANSYTELYSRLPHLANATQHLETYFRIQKDSNRNTGSGMYCVWGEESSEVRLTLPKGEVHNYLMTISLQTEVTKFLQRCENLRPSVAQYWEAPLPTLFGNGKVKMDVAIAVMMAGNSIDDGFGIAFRIIQEFRLNSTIIYTQVVKRLAKAHKYKEIRQLLSCVQDSGLSDKQSYDEVIGACIRVIAGEPSESKEVESFIKMLKIDTNKINAYILCTKLKSAYLIAVRGERADDIKRIAGAAERAGHTAVKNICTKWLTAYHERQKEQFQATEMTSTYSKR